MKFSYATNLWTVWYLLCTSKQVFREVSFRLHDEAINQIVIPNLQTKANNEIQSNTCTKLLVTPPPKTKTKTKNQTKTKTCPPKYMHIVIRLFSVRLIDSVYSLQFLKSFPKIVFLHIYTVYRLVLRTSEVRRGTASGFYTLALTVWQDLVCPAFHSKYAYQNNFQIFN